MSQQGGSPILSLSIVTALTADCSKHERDGRAEVQANYTGVHVSAYSASRHMLSRHTDPSTSADVHRQGQCFR